MTNTHTEPTPVFNQLNQTFNDARENAYKRGKLQTQLDLIEYIQTELTAKRLPASKGVRQIIEWLAKQS